MSTQEITGCGRAEAYAKVDDIIKKMTQAELAVLVQSFTNILQDVWDDFAHYPGLVLGHHPGEKLLVGLTDYRKLLKQHAEALPENKKLDKTQI